MSSPLMIDQAWFQWGWLERKTIYSFLPYFFYLAFRIFDECKCAEIQWFQANAFFFNHSVFIYLSEARRVNQISRTIRHNTETSFSLTKILMKAWFDRNVHNLHHIHSSSINFYLFFLAFMCNNMIWINNLFLPLHRQIYE